MSAAGSDQMIGVMAISTNAIPGPELPTTSSRP